MEEEGTAMTQRSFEQSAACETTVNATGAVDASAVGAAAPEGARSIARYVWAGLGFLFFGLAIVGVAIPILPTTPFALVAAFCFARSSKRLNTWFKSTPLYRKVLEGYAARRSMTVKAKLSILIPVTVLLAIGFALMANVSAGRVAVVLVWIGHIVYFGFVVKTDKGKDATGE